jgi:hypothetical protein
MPCVDPEADAEMAREDAKKLNSLTDMLCRLCKLAERKFKLPADIADWWKAHQAADLLREGEERQQRAREALKANALRKLTPQEQRALGLK